MLTDDDYDMARALLVEHDLPIIGASGHNGGFGSWYITVGLTAGRGLRLVHDGRDGWLYVEVGEAPCATEFHRLRDLWLDRKPSEGAVQEAVRVILHAAGWKGDDVPS